MTKSVAMISLLFIIYLLIYLFFVECQTSDMSVRAAKTCEQWNQGDVTFWARVYGYCGCVRFGENGVQVELQLLSVERVDR